MFCPLHSIFAPLVRSHALVKRARNNSLREVQVPVRMRAADSGTVRHNAAAREHVLRRLRQSVHDAVVRRQRLR